MGVDDDEIESIINSDDDWLLIADESRMIMDRFDRLPAELRAVARETGMSCDLVVDTAVNVLRRHPVRAVAASITMEILTEARRREHWQFMREAASLYQ